MLFQQKVANSSAEDIAFEFDSAVMATPISSDDEIAPWVKEVVQAVSQKSTRAMLDDDTDEVITIDFSETLDASYIDSNSTRVRDVDAGEYLEHTASYSGKTLTITLTGAQDRLLARPGNKMDVLMLKDDFRDTAANALGVTVANGDTSVVGYDEDLTTSVGGNYVRLKFLAFAETNMDAQRVTLDETSQQKEDGRGVNDLDLIQANNDTFLDVDDMTVGIQQLNSAEDSDFDPVDPSPVSDAQERAQALLNAVAGKIDSQEDMSLQANTAGIHFTATNANYYELNVLDSVGVSKFNGLAQVELDGGTFDDAPNANRFVADVAEGDDQYLVLQGVVPGDIVQITPFDQFGYSGTLSNVTLVDNVAPTTVLQNSYGVPADSNNGEVTSREYGDGGEQSSTSSVKVGTPFLNITPRMLGLVNGLSEGTDEHGEEGIYTLKALFDANVVDPSTGKPFIDELNYSAPQVFGVYDAVAYTNWTTVSDDAFIGSRTIGVAFSEDIVLSADPVLTGENSGSTYAGLSGFIAKNDIQKQDENDPTFADLVQFDIDNVLTLANQDHGAQVDFSSVITDAQGNSGASSASVIVGDAMPPLVKSALYKGSSLVVTFNEEVAVDTTTTLTLGSKVITLDQDTVDAFEASSDKTVLTILPGSWSGKVDRTATFSLAQYEENAPADTDFSDGKNGHARLDFSKVEDVHGNSWSDFSDSSKQYFMQQPDFAAVDETGLFTVNGSDDGTTIGSTTLKVRFSGTHPMDVDAWDTNDDGQITGSELDGKFTYSAGTIDPTHTGHKAVRTNNGKTLTVTLELSAGTADSGAVVQINEDKDGTATTTEWGSAWDNTEYATVVSSEAKLN